MNLNFQERLEECRQLFGRHAIFSNAVFTGPDDQRGMLAFISRRPFQGANDFNDALNMIVTRRPRLASILVRWPLTGLQQLIMWVTADLYHVTQPTLAAPTGPFNGPATHTRQEVWDDIALPFMVQWSQGARGHIFIMSVVLRAGYVMTQIIRQGERTHEAPTNALLYDNIDGNYFFYLLQNVGPGDELRHMYRLGTLNQLPVDNRGKRKNPYTQQDFDLRDVRMGLRG